MNTSAHISVNAPKTSAKKSESWGDTPRTSVVWWGFFILTCTCAFSVLGLLMSAALLGILIGKIHPKNWKWFLSGAASVALGGIILFVGIGALSVLRICCFILVAIGIYCSLLWSGQMSGKTATKEKADPRSG